MKHALLLLLIGLLATPVLAEEDRAAATIKVWDTNGDGVLTPDEFPDKATFKKADRDADGKVTRDEVAIFLGLVKPPKPVAPQKGDAEEDPKGEAPPKKPPVKKPEKKAETKTDA